MRFPRLLKFFVSIIFSLISIYASFIFQKVQAGTLETGALSLSAASSIKNLKDDSFLNFGGIFSSEGNVSLEEISILVDEDMNEKGGVAVYFVVCYDKELLTILKTDSASQFESRLKKEYFKKKYDDRIFIAKWSKQAKKDAETYEVADLYEKDYLVPLGGFIFVTYNTPGDHTYVIPPAWKKIRIHLKKKDFHVEQIEE